MNTRWAMGIGAIACGVLVMTMLQAQDKKVVLSDVELVRAAQDRKALTRITAEPVFMGANTAFLCDNPDEDLAIQVKGLEWKNPHRQRYIHVFTSTNAVASMRSQTNTFPQGSLILKEKFSDVEGKQTELFTGMLKHERGYNPECGDLEFFTVSGDAKKVISRGKLHRCMDCHVEYPERDFVTKATYPLVRRNRINNFKD